MQTAVFFFFFFGGILPLLVSLNMREYNATMESTRAADGEHEPLRSRLVPLLTVRPLLPRSPFRSSVRNDSARR